MFERMYTKLVHVRPNLLLLVFLFWLLQLVVWVLMIMYVQFFPNSLKTSILYTIQISHWALVITCGTAATATWALLAAKHAHELVLASLQKPAEAAPG